MTGRGATDQVRVAGNRDRTGVAAMLARAFADDPAMRFIFPDPAERAIRLPRLFALLFEVDGPAGMRLLTAGGEAATLWRAPGRAHSGTWEMIGHAWPMWRALGGAIGRALKLSSAVDSHHPSGSYWYLHIAGCDPAAQGRGLGGAAVRSGLRRIAASGLPVYLETPLEQNVGFYQGLGFELTSDWQVPGGGPRFWSMIRAAGGGG